MAGCLSEFSPNSLKPPSNLSFGLVWSTFFRWVQTRIRTGFFGVLRVKCTKRRRFLSSGNVLQFPLRSANCCETVKTRNLVGRGTGARVQIPSPPPGPPQCVVRCGGFFVFPALMRPGLFDPHGRGDHHALHLAGALIDLGDLGVPHHPLKGVFLGHAVRAH